MKNVTRNAEPIRLWFWPNPFIQPTDLHALRLRCRDAKTWKEVKYKWPPPGKSVSDGMGKELTETIPPGKSWIDPIDFREFCDLPVGSYIAELQYDTRFCPSWVKPDAKAWHGATNKVEIRIRVFR
ncbi:MAG TPA: hypothetical protein VGL56_09670 [Fimbriimonadaceae bacterium]